MFSIAIDSLQGVCSVFLAKIASPTVKPLRRHALQSVMAFLTWWRGLAIKPANVAAGRAIKAILGAKESPIWLTEADFCLAPLLPQ